MVPEYKFWIWPLTRRFERDHGPPWYFGVRSPSIPFELETIHSGDPTIVNRTRSPVGVVVRRNHREPKSTGSWHERQHLESEDRGENTGVNGTLRPSRYDRCRQGPKPDGVTVWTTSPGIRRPSWRDRSRRRSTISWNHRKVNVDGVRRTGEVTKWTVSPGVRDRYGTTDVDRTRRLREIVVWDDVPKVSVSDRYFWHFWLHSRIKKFTCL